MVPLNEAALDVLQRRQGDHHGRVQAATCGAREAGTPTHELQRLSGWKTQSMVERYAHVAPEGLQFAASRLDSILQAA